jgi:polar amino acid transport system permease protein
MPDFLTLISIGPRGWGDELLRGAGLTLALALVTLPIGVTLGLLLAFAKHSTEPSLRLFGHAMTTLFRGLPELLTLFLVYFGGQQLIREVARLLGFASAWQLDGFMAGVVALSVVFAAYSSEVFLGALKVLSRGSVEAARALGLGRWHSFRFVIAPELFRLALPGLSNVVLSLVKQTSLVAVISYDELLRSTAIAAGSTHQPLFFFAIACLLYLGLTALVAVAFRRADLEVNRGLRAP